MLTWKANDTYPPLTVALTQTDADGNTIPLDLTGCTVTFLMRKAGSADLISRAAAVDDELGGIVRVDWEAADLAAVKDTDCQVQFEVTRSDLKKHTVPNVGFLALRIEADLNNA